MTALMWLAYELTHSARWPSFLAAVQIGPTFLLGAFGGMLADRVPRKQLILLTQSAFLICALAILLLHLAGLLNVWVMMIVMMTHGVIQAIDVPARLSFIPGLVDRNDLPNAIALNSMLFNSARALGPAIAGALLTTSGPGWCFGVNLMSYVAVLVAVLMIHVPPEHRRPPKGSDGSGLRVLAKQPTLMWVMVLAGITAIGGWPLLPLLPMFAEVTLGRAEGGYGTMLSTVGIGALLAALTVATIGNDVSRKKVLLAGLTCVTIGLAGISQSTHLAAASAWCLLFGFGMILFFATGQSAVQLGTADGDRGKVMGIWAMMLSAGVPMGNLVFGPAADAYGVTTVIAIQAVVMLVATLLLLFGPKRVCTTQ